MSVIHLLRMTLFSVYKVKGVPRLIQMRSINAPGILSPRDKHATHRNIEKWLGLLHIVSNNGIRRARTTAILEAIVHHMECR